MRTEQEVIAAVSHLVHAMLACPKEERDGSTYRSAYMTFTALTWVLNHKDGEPFAELLAGMKRVDALFASLGGTVQ